MAGRISKADDSTTAGDGFAETRSPRTGPAAPSTAAGDASRRSAQTRGERDPQESAGERLARLESTVRGVNPLDRNRALLAYIDQLGPGDFEDAVAHFRGLGITEERMGEYSMLLSAWASMDPTAALAFAEANTRNSFARNTILTTWATSDPDAAIRWAQANYDGDQANPYMAGIIRGIASMDSARATELLASMPRSEERAQGLDFLLPHLLQQGVDATKAWIASINDDSLKNGAMLRTAEELAETDPAGTAGWLMANPGEASQRRMDDVYQVWASNDYNAAFQSFSALPAGNERSNALRGLVSNAASEDPQVAVDLMDRFPDDVTDRAIQSVIWQSFGKDTALAADQIARITDQGDREAMYRRALGAWVDRDQEAAQGWLRANPVPESVQGYLDNRAEERRSDRR